jgi:predicted transcriptional regulator
MTVLVELTPEMQTRLEREATKRGQGTSVIVADALEKVLPPAEQDDDQIEAGWAALMELVEKSQMDTGITDLAHQHDHYLHGTPKRGMGEEAL